MKKRNPGLTAAIVVTSMPVAALVVALVVAIPAPAQAASGSVAVCRVAPASPVDQMLAGAYPSQARHAAYNQTLDMRDDTGYNTGYLFAMTKAVASGPITPGLKPLLFLFTVPLDIITLPFTAIAGFF
ncbi:MAG TPA: hypothetical protein VFO62_07555 [Candidatus Binatia bacterium]|nr:hypothetical protein [Candidatus Binatia bacterium]